MAKQSSFARKIKKNPIAVIIIGLIVIASCIITYLVDNQGNTLLKEDNSDFIIDFIDVGQGDCELIRCEGTVILIDGGEADEASTVIRFLNNKCIDTIDYYILTHPHSDHIGAAPSIMKKFKIGTVISTAISDDNLPTTACYEKTVKAISKYASDYIEVSAGDEFKWGNLSVSILAPFEESEEYNDISVCTRFEYKKFSVLLCGDATTTVENQILENGEKIKSDIMKISHHGSRSSNSYDFIKEIAPDLAVISCGKDNSYGHPHKETLNTLSQLDIDYFETDIYGNISVYSDGNTYFAETQR